MDNKLTVVTVVSDKFEHGFVQLLQPSSKLFSFNLVVLEVDSKSYKSHRCKDLLLYQYLESHDDEEIILFTDGYDTMFLCPDQEILAKYYQLDKEIIFSAEINCWPDITLASKYEEIKSPFKYLCSGGFIGKAKYIKKKLQQKFETNSIRQYPKSNQVYWTEQFLRDRENIALDTQCQIFLTLSSEIDMFFIREPEAEENFNNYLQRKVDWFNKNFSVSQKRIYNKITNTTPCHLHANGLSKLIMKEIADILGQGQLQFSKKRIKQ